MGVGLEVRVGPHLVHAARLPTVGRRREALHLRMEMRLLHLLPNAALARSSHHGAAATADGSQIEVLQRVQCSQVQITEVRLA